MKDTSGGALPGVTVTLTNRATAVTQTTTTGAEGVQLRLEMFNFLNHTQFSGRNGATNITNGAGQTGAAIFNNYTNLTITNNLRPAGNTSPLGQYFGEYSAARDPRIIQLAVKLYF